MKKGSMVRFVGVEIDFWEMKPAVMNATLTIEMLILTFTDV